jgi:hypothetical protein
MAEKRHERTFRERLLGTSEGPDYEADTGVEPEPTTPDVEDVPADPPE